MPVRLYTDECVDGRVVAGLRRRGIDVMTAAEAELLGASDERHLSHATRASRVIVTADHDFLRLADGWQRAETPFPGMVFIVAPASIGPTVRAIALVATVLEPDEIAGWIEWVP